MKAGAQEEKEQLGIQEWRYGVMTGLLTELFFEYDAGADILYLYGDTAEFFGEQRTIAGFSDCLGNPEPDSHIKNYQILYRLISKEELHFYEESQMYGRRRGKCWLLIQGEKFFDNDRQETVRIVGKLVNIDEEKKRQQKKLQSARLDMLTGAYNKEAAVSLIASRLKQWNDYQFFAFMMLDIDNFKHINDTFGYAYGDRILKKAVKMIRSLVREEDIVGRFDGDQFCIFLNGIPSEVEAGNIAERICGAFTRIFISDQENSGISCSLGVTVCNGGYKSVEQIYAEADKALCAAKQAGHNGYRFFRNK